MAEGKDETKEEEIPKKDIYMSSWITIQEVDIPNQKFVALGFYNMFWKDPGLKEKYNIPDDAKGRIEDVQLDKTDLPWQADNMFDNAIENDVQDDFYYDAKTGLVRVMFKSTATFNEHYELFRFPFDRQFLNLQMKAKTSAQGWRWLGKKPHWVPAEQPKELTLGQDELDKFDKAINSRVGESVIQWKNVPAWIDYYDDEEMTLKCRVERDPTYYTSHVIFPCFIIVLSAFTSFAIDYQDVADRLSVNLTVMLTAVAFEFVVSDVLPKGGQITIMDMYLNMAFLWICFLVLENVMVAKFASDSDQAASIDAVSAWSLGVLWSIINIFFFVQDTSLQCVRKPWLETAVEDLEENPNFEYCPGEQEYIFDPNTPPPDQLNKSLQNQDEDGEGEAED